MPSPETVVGMQVLAAHRARIHRPTEHGGGAMFVPHHPHRHPSETLTLHAVHWYPVLTTAAVAVPALFSWLTWSIFSTMCRMAMIGAQTAAGDLVRSSSPLHQSEVDTRAIERCHGDGPHSPTLTDSRLPVPYSEVRQVQLAHRRRTVQTPTYTNTIHPAHPFTSMSNQGSATAVHRCAAVYSLLWHKHAAQAADCVGGGAVVQPTEVKRLPSHTTTHALAATHCTTPTSGVLWFHLVYASAHEVDDDTL